MPTVIDKATGGVVEEFSYDEAGEQAANDMEKLQLNTVVSAAMKIQNLLPKELKKKNLILQ